MQNPYLYDDIHKLIVQNMDIRTLQTVLVVNKSFRTQALDVLRTTPVDSYADYLSSIGSFNGSRISISLIKTQCTQNFADMYEPAFARIGAQLYIVYEDGKKHQVELLHYLIQIVLNTHRGVYYVLDQLFKSLYEWNDLGASDIQDFRKRWAFSTEFKFSLHKRSQFMVSMDNFGSIIHELKRRSPKCVNRAGDTLTLSLRDQTYQITKNRDDAIRFYDPTLTRMGSYKFARRQYISPDILHIYLMIQIAYRMRKF